MDLENQDCAGQPSWRARLREYRRIPRRRWVESRTLEPLPASARAETELLGHGHHPNGPGVRRRPRDLPGRTGIARAYLQALDPQAEASRQRTWPRLWCHRTEPPAPEETLR